MKKALIIAGAFGVVIVIGGVVAYNTFNHSGPSDTDRKLAEMQRKIDELSGKSGPSNIVVGGSATQAGTTIERQRLISATLEEGYKLLNTRDKAKVENAVTIFNEGIKNVDANNAEFHNGLARSLLVLGRYDESLAAFDKAHTLDPKLADAVSGAGWAHWNKKEYFEAKRAWEQSLTLNPKSHDALSALSWIYLGLGERDKALSAFKILVDSGAERNDWKIGLTMARAGNTDIRQVRTMFPMPDASAFTQPTSAPATRHAP